ncbi:DUF6055 domain-containing protein [Bacteroides sp. 519]|uniref:DUF6055 domain-containing protein n=1 Tax=Bacteroides sp. 519 TaxID=2302937 RepID=UPI0013D3F393|nr:DUF6055 domain-containing protein [Bacteroides sp. 519]NDV58488.1 DUF4859 domain-containing protein [Bacteroides sp. 519]
MKYNIRRYIHLMVSVIAVGGMSLLASCEDDDMSKSKPDYDPRYKGTIDGFGTADYNLESDTKNTTITFNSDMAWTAAIIDSEGNPCEWASISPESGEAGEELTITVTLKENEDISNSRTATVTISTEKGSSSSISIAQHYKVLYLDPADIKDYDKYICPASGNPHFENGPESLLRHDSYYSWHRMKQSEHFFVFWSPEFGEDPNSTENQASNMWVDIDDLLLKAEQYFATNINTLGMAVLGEGKSMLDDYKMQIYLIYQDEWLATGSGYDDKIGALWVNPATCHPVGSTIAHEIGHSFQYQVYADKVNKQGYPADLHHGFRYGFGPDGAGGCAFWEQGAQWQAQLDYPEEMFGGHLSVFKKNYHRHFNHEWMRYASYWLQHVWVEKYGKEAYGRIWRDSEFPEDPLQTYQRIYCNNDLNTLYADLYDYASHMVYFDLKFANNENKPVTVPSSVKGDYSTDLYKIGDLEYQVGYESCPGTTGFNVIELKVPASGTTISTTINAIAPGSALAKGDKGQQVDGDGAAVSKTKNYNASDNVSSDYRYGYVAIVNGTPTYSAMTKGAKGTASFTVPAGTNELYFVIMAAPGEYNRQYWNDLEADDEQWPYSIKVSGTDVASYNELVEIELDPNATPQHVKMTINVRGTAESSYDFARYNIAYYDNAAICHAFCLMPEDIDEIFHHSSEGLAEGKICMRLKLTDGSYSYDDNCGGELGGFWCNAIGEPQGWGENARTYTKLHTISDMEVGFMPGTITAGETYPQIVELVYTKGGQEYIATLNFNFIVE